MAGPLSGIKVVEMGVWVAGPAAAGILADWGAEVIKVEPPGIGDPARTGRGQLVSTSLLREGLYTLSFDLAFGVRLGVPIRKAAAPS